MTSSPSRLKRHLPRDSTAGKPVGKTADQLQARWGRGKKLPAEVNVRGRARGGGTSGSDGLPAAVAEGLGFSLSPGRAGLGVHVGFPRFGSPAVPPRAALWVPVGFSPLVLWCWVDSLAFPDAGCGTWSLRSAGERKL